MKKSCPSCSSKKDPNFLSWDNLACAFSKLPLHNCLEWGLRVNPQCGLEYVNGRSLEKSTLPDFTVASRISNTIALADYEDNIIIYERRLCYHSCKYLVLTKDEYRKIWRQNNVQSLLRAGEARGCRPVPPYAVCSIGSPTENSLDLITEDRNLYIRRRRSLKCKDAVVIKISVDELMMMRVDGEFGGYASARNPEQEMVDQAVATVSRLRRRENQKPRKNNRRQRH